MLAGVISNYLMYMTGAKYTSNDRQGFLARVPYDSEMGKVKDAWPTMQKPNAEQLALYTI
jgi:hypothetical protein